MEKMNWHRIKLRKSDKIFSQYIRMRDGYQCQICVRTAAMGYQMQASHYFGRSVESTRFDPENVDTFCAGCHRRLHGKGNTEYDTFKKKQLGGKRYNQLLVRGYQERKKRDDFLDEKYCQKLLDDLNIQWT